jgi:SAM-dependent methyltransferase
MPKPKIPGRLKSLYKGQQFRPRWYSVWINPFYLIRRDLYKALAELAPEIQGGSLLDFGCGAKPYRHLFGVDEYIGLDMENPGHSHLTEEVDVYYDGRTIPFETNRFDAALASEVLEHVFEPNLVLKELHRVLKPGAKVIFSVPFAWNEHEMPNDYARYTQGGFASLLERNGFGVVRSSKTNRFTATWLQMGILGWYQCWATSNRFLNLFLGLFLLGPVNLLAGIIAYVVPGSESWYCNTVVLAKVRKEIPVLTDEYDPG